MPPMPRFLETIRIFEGRIDNLSYHQARLERTFRAHYRGEPPSLLEALQERPTAGLFRARIYYSDTIESVAYLPYKPKVLRTFTAINSSIEYGYKYADRSALETLTAQVDTDDVLIVKEGLVTDTTIANIAFFDGRRWITPKHPLLEGTMRAKLIDEGRLITADLQPSDLKKYEQCAIMNAMLGFRVLKHVRIFDENGIVLFEREGYDKR